MYNSPFDACIQACLACAMAGEKHDMEHCQQCAEACRKCADQCRKMTVSR